MYASIIANNYQGIYELVSHLIEKHHCKKIGHAAHDFTGGKPDFETRRR